jgi:hypothetical protein
MYIKDWLEVDQSRVSIYYIPYEICLFKNCGLVSVMVAPGLTVTAYDHHGL